MPAPPDRPAAPALRDARDALARAEALLARGEAAAARPWLERATRLAPNDATLRAMLAGALIGHDDARAAALFAALAETVDIREIWLGLAGAEARCRRFPAAGAALARLLSRHIADDAALALAFALSPRLDAPGFCAIARDGRAGAPALVLAPANPRATIAVRLDGRPLHLPAKGEAPPRLALPPTWHTARWLTVTADSVPLCASPIDIAALNRLEGYVAADGSGGLQGWAWYPGDPDADPRLCLRDADGAARRFQARLAGASAGVLARPRGFALTGAALAGLRPPFAVTDA
ncbi:MAG: hypothetical protein KGL12_04390, partial [Rhodospirillales bacterium]|nr:hypothetical protein [Rhodospirillales bacterium]